MKITTISSGYLQNNQSRTSILTYDVATKVAARKEIEKQLAT
jgi:hypothetical protein